MLKAIVPAALASLLVCSAASAEPMTNTAATKTVTGTDLVQVVKKRNYSKRHYRGDRKHRAGRHYHRHRHYRGPRGWRRYGYRPYDWETRGCIVVGPVWFCP